MPYTQDHKDHTRIRILDSARRLFNRNGLTAISIDEIMAGAGLTRGGFYNHFGSKEELYAEAITQFLRSDPPPAWQRPAMQDAGQGLRLAQAMLDVYLSREHLADIDESCPVIGLASDVARGGAAVKKAYREVMVMMSGIFAANLGPNPVIGQDNDPADDAQRALAVVAMCVGAMVLARAVDDGDTADELRAAARIYAMALAGWQPGAATPSS